MARTAENRVMLGMIPVTFSYHRGNFETRMFFHCPPESYERKPIIPRRGQFGMEATS